MVDPLTALSDWIMWVAGGAVAVVTPVLGVVYRNRERSTSNKRQLEGDPGDPNSEGVLQIAKGNGEKIDTLSTRMDTQHRELMAKFEELRDRVEQGTGGDFYRGGSEADD